MEETELAASRDAASAVRLRGISKSFGDALVLDSVDFDLRWGEVHALLGENGAGKSTLMNVLTGIYAADSGNIEIDEVPVSIRSPTDAMRLGIGMVHQHFKLVMPFTARENLRLAAGGQDVSWDDLDRQINDILARTGLAVPLDVPVSALSVAERQRIEILKVLILGARILVFDEPTAVLTDQEAESLLALMRDLLDAGHAVIFITHKLREVLSVGDRVSTLRRGQMVMNGQQVMGVTSAQLSEAMIGKKAASAPVRKVKALAQPLLQISDLTVRSGDIKAVQDASFTLHEGEILGLAGVGGNGQSELAEAVLGLRPSEGEIMLDGKPVGSASVAERRALGLRYIPADRASDALCPNLSVNENLAAAAVRTSALGNRIVTPKQIADFATNLIDTFAIAGATSKGRRPIRLLSGGNAQKSVLARELDDEARLIIAHSPTRGLDIAACQFVHNQFLEATQRGVGILLISEDLEEILALSDNIHVISHGRLSTTPDTRPNREDIGALMLGDA